MWSHHIVVRTIDTITIYYERNNTYHNRYEILSSMVASEDEFLKHKDRIVEDVRVQSLSLRTHLLETHNNNNRYKTT